MEGIRVIYIQRIILPMIYAVNSYDSFFFDTIWHLTKLYFYKCRTAKVSSFFL